MAGDWIAWAHGLAKKPEVLQLARRLNLDRRYVATCCMEIWEWFDRETVDGVTSSVTVSLLDEVAGVTGFCAALVAVGWLNDDGQNVSLPNFDRWNSQTAKVRLLATKRQQRHRTAALRGSRPRHTKSVTPSVTKASPEVQDSRELTTDTTYPAKAPAVTSGLVSPPKPETSPPPLVDSETAVPEQPKPRPKKTWAQERYEELISITADGLTYAKGMPLLNKLKTQFGQETVELAILELAKGRKLVEIKDLWAVFNARCKALKARQPVGAAHAGNGEVSESLKHHYDPATRRSL